MSAYLSLLQRRPHFRYLWLAQVISLFGDWFNAIATVMLVNRFADSGLAVSALFLARALPPFFAGPLAGVAADRFDRRTILIVTDLLRALIVLGFLLIDRPERLWLIYVLSAAQFIVSAFFEPARSAIVPQLVAEEELVAANTLSSVTWSAMLAVGGAVGGAVAAALGAEAALVIDAVTFLLSAFLITRVRLAAPGVGVRTERSGWRDFLDGLAYVRRRTDVAWVAVVKGLGQTGSVDVIAAVLAARVFPLGPEGGGALGLMFTAFGVGTVLGPIVGNAFHDGASRQLQRAILGGFGLIVAGWLVVGLAPSLWIMLLGWVLRGMGGSINWTYSDILIQLKVPTEFLGRVFALNLAIFTLFMSASTWASGLLLDQLQIEPRLLALWLGLASLAPVGLWALFLRAEARAAPPAVRAGTSR